MCLTDGLLDRQVQHKFSWKYSNICYRTVKIIHKKCHANLSAWNDRAITANNKLNCLPYQMINVVNLSLRRVHNSERKNRVLLHGFFLKRRSRYTCFRFREFNTLNSKECEAFQPLLLEKRKENCLL